MVVKIAFEGFEWLSYRSEEFRPGKEPWLDIRIESMMASDGLVGENNWSFEKLRLKTRWISAAVRTVVGDGGADSIFVAVSFENRLFSGF